MKHIDEYRDPALIRRLVGSIEATATRPWTIMEVCGGQTHAILRFGLDQLLPSNISLIHGPGCPVCVTPVELIDHAIAISQCDGVTLCSFGDMLRVPGSDCDLMSAKATGADVKIVYSPLDAVALAEAHPDREFVFFAVGFETTAPTTAMAVYQARQKKLRNFSVLVSHVLVPPAMAAILSSPDNHVQGFLAAGHVCMVMGWQEYLPIAETFRVPIIVTGFEPVDLLNGVLSCIRQLEAGRSGVENQYTRAVRPDGNRVARTLIEEVYEVVDQSWRGLGAIPNSGFALRPAFADFDAAHRFPTRPTTSAPTAACLAGEVLTGRRRPCDCPAFGLQCTPDTPLGAPMVSSEGACAAYYRYRPSHSTTQGAIRD
jgi:hydrogenase expression/formation protein HypD